MRSLLEVLIERRFSGKLIAHIVCMLFSGKIAKNTLRLCANLGRTIYGSVLNVYVNLFIMKICWNWDN